MKQKLEFLSNAENLFSLNQETINSFKLDDEMKYVAISSLDLFLKKNKNHFFYDIMMKQIDRKFENFDFVYIKKYPLPATFNTVTKKGIINFAVYNRKNLLNVNPRDIYTIILYCYVFSLFTFILPKKDLQRHISEYIFSILMKIYAKKYGLVSTFENEIPKLRYLINYYINISFFNIEKNQTQILASKFSSYRKEDFRVDLDDYNFKSVKDFIRVLSDVNVFPGLNEYLFLNTMINRLLLHNVCVFEDIVRFLTILAASSVNSNILCPVIFQFFNKSIYNEILLYIEKSL